MNYITKHKINNTSNILQEIKLKGKSSTHSNNLNTLIN
jgi:hypothetical protein